MAMYRLISASVQFDEDGRPEYYEEHQASDWMPYDEVIQELRLAQQCNPPAAVLSGQHDGFKEVYRVERES